MAGEVADRAFDRILGDAPDKAAAQGGVCVDCATSVQEKTQNQKDLEVLARVAEQMKKKRKASAKKGADCIACDNLKVSSDGKVTVNNATGENIWNQFPEIM